jgi:hypothetical protein
VLPGRKVAHLIGDGEHARSDRAASRRPFRLDLSDRRDLAAKARGAGLGEIGLRGASLAQA